MRYNVMLMKNKYCPVFTGGEIGQIFNKKNPDRKIRKTNVKCGKSVRQETRDYKHYPEKLMKDMFIQSCQTVKEETL